MGGVPPLRTSQLRVLQQLWGTKDKKMWDTLVLMYALMKKTSLGRLEELLKDSQSTGQPVFGLLLFGPRTAKDFQSMQEALETVWISSYGTSIAPLVVEMVTIVGDQTSLEEDEEVPF